MAKDGTGMAGVVRIGLFRIGVGARLYGALAFNGLVALLIGLGAYVAFDGLHAGITRVTSEQFPAVVAAAKLERQHQRIMRSLEQLALSNDNFGRETINQGLSDQLGGYDRLLAELESGDSRPAQRIGGLKQQRDEILRLREAIDRGVAARIAARRALTERDRDVKRVADALADPALRGQEDLAVQRWLAKAERLLFLTASVHQTENSFGLSRLGDGAVAQLAALAGDRSALPEELRPRVAQLTEGMRAVVEGDRSVFRQRQAELQASEALTGLVDRANQVSLVNTGLNTGIFVEQTRAAEDSRRQIIEVSTTYTRLFFASVGVVLVGMVLSVAYVRRKVLARLWAVSEAIRDRTEGGAADIPVTGTDEIGELARALRFYIHETGVKSEALRRNEQWLRTVLEAAPVPLVISGRDDGQIRFVNRRAADLFGVAEAAILLGRPASSVWAAPDVREDFVRDVFATGLALDVETELVTESGGTIWGLLSGIAFEFQGEEVLLSSVVDITRRREAEEMLRRTRAFLDAVIDNVPSVLYVLDGDTGRVVLWNRAAEEAFGTGRAAIQDRALPDALGEETGRALAGGTAGALRSLGLEELVLARNGETGKGETAVYALQRHPFEWSGDGRCHIICIANDITASRRAREELRQAKERAERADAAKTEFLATVSHEMRTPLNGILGLCRLLLTGRLEPGERRYAVSIMRCGHGLLDQVNDILDLRKIEDGKLDLDPGPCALLPVLEEVVATVESLASEKGIALDLDIAADVPELIVVDRQRLRQILVNLVGNAVKFTERGGVDLRVGLARDDEGERLTVSVRDTGIGVPPDRRAAIFEKLEQADPTIARRFGGSGLGLAIVRHLLDAMQGTIAVDSAVGLGSIFTVTIPLERVAAVALPEAPGRLLPIHRVRSLALLLVEDDAINREVALGLLSDAGHRVTVAETGEKALALAAQRRFDAVLLDIRLPDIDGPEVARRIRALPDDDRAAVPIVAVTANVFAADRARYLAAGIDTVIEKPIFPERLMHLLSNSVPMRPEPAAEPRPVAAVPREATVNEEILDRYVRSLGAKRFATIRGLLLEAAADGLPRLAAPETADADLEDIAHRLSGAASHFGLTAFVGLMRAVEDGVREGRRDEAQALAATAAEAFTRGVAAMDALCGAMAG
ncbi:ATP-binding protein [Azospirillum doebereinerae]|uniref:ATP-binding protein n=1 Tax=Azospirillum doebereinerae TaxID=92933 RepID=UPI001EE58E74|nr:ATP-binding protein [Azospirillum doebereinerae]MCG5244001.1 ATP-binding protein [Azospirillum doebereinerae]